MLSVALPLVIPDRPSQRLDVAGDLLDLACPSRPRPALGAHFMECTVQAESPKNPRFCGAICVLARATVGRELALANQDHASIRSATFRLDVGRGDRRACHGAHHRSANHLCHVRSNAISAPAAAMAALDHALRQQLGDVAPDQGHLLPSTLRAAQNGAAVRGHPLCESADSTSARKEPDRRQTTVTSRSYEATAADAGPASLPSVARATVHPARRPDNVLIGEAARKPRLSLCLVVTVGDEL